MIWLDNSRVLAVLAVIFVHISDGFLAQYPVGSEYWWIGNIYDSAVRWCVPMFVMISGALLLDPAKHESLLTFYRKRFSRIFLPTLVWAVFFTFWIYFKGVLVADVPPQYVLLKSLFSGQPYYHMWFLYMIMGLYMFTPFLRKIVAHSTSHELFVLVLLTFGIAVISGFSNSFFREPFIYWFLPYTPYFLVGYLIRLDNRKHSRKMLCSIFLVSVFLTCVIQYYSNFVSAIPAGYSYNYLSLTVVPMSISLMYLLKTWSRPMFSPVIAKKLSILSLGVYLVHPIILEIIHYKGHPAIQFYPLFSIPVLALIVFIVSSLGMWILHQTPYLKKII